MQLLLNRRLKNLRVDVSLQYLPNSPHAVMNIGSMIKDGYHAKENMKIFSLIKKYTCF